ncbi:MAG: LCP family protein [Chloroflexota bacterium]|nr:LCP family protein [Chloroflexota bacterium]
MIHTGKETVFFPQSLVSILLLGVAVLAACRPAAPSPIPPTPIAYHTDPTPAVKIAVNRNGNGGGSESPAPLPRSRSQLQPITVLLLGTDRRDPDSGLAVNNTDTLMLFHLDPDAQRIVILSIPRDLYVEIPGREQKQGRINTAYALGEQGGTGGLVLARQTVSATLGIPVQHAALLDFHAFITLIDAIGGVDVEVPYAISDPTYPDNGIGYDPFHLPAGQQHLDGATALKYVRTRATPGDDFDRTTRQRQLVLAVRDRVTQLDLLPGLIAQSPQLWAALQIAFETDLTLGEIVDLVVIASRVPADQVVTASIDQTCIHFWATPTDADVLIPDQAAIKALLTDLFPASPPTAATSR